MFFRFDTTSIIMCWSLIGSGIMWVMFWPLKVMNSSTGMQSCPTSARRHSAISAKGNGPHAYEWGEKKPQGVWGVTRVLQSLVIMTMCSGDITTEDLHRGHGVSAVLASSVRVLTGLAFGWNMTGFLMKWEISKPNFQKVETDSQNKVMLYG